MAPRSILRRLAAPGCAAIGVACASPAAAVSCTISVTPIAFGNYNGISKAQVTTSATLTLSCTGPGNLTYTITLSPGQSGNQTARAMTSGSNALSYQIYKDSGYAQVMGDGTGGTTTLSQSVTLPSGTTTGNAPLYGKIAAGQNVAPGSYADTLTLLLTY